MEVAWSVSVVVWGTLGGRGLVVVGGSSDTLCGGGLASGLALGSSAMLGGGGLASGLVLGSSAMLGGGGLASGLPLDSSAMLGGRGLAGRLAFGSGQPCHRSLPALVTARLLPHWVHTRRSREPSH